MNRDDLPDCILCGSDNVLPFEDDTPAHSETLFLSILTAILIILGYILFMISSYIFFPLVVFAGIIVVTRWINKYNKEKARKASILEIKEYVCLDCNGFFKK